MPKPALPSLPPGWTRQPLGAIASRVTQRNRTGDTNALTISAKDGLVRQAEYFNRRVAGEDLRQYFLLRRGDFAYNKSYSAGYPVGAIRRLDRYDSGIVSPLYICFRAGAAWDSNFLKHHFEAGCLDSQIAWVAKEGVRNHGLLNVGVDDFFSVEVDLPPVREQRRIAEILDSVDESIHSTERLIAKLRSASRAVLDNLLSVGLGASGRPHHFQEESPPIHSAVGMDMFNTWPVTTVEEAFRIDDRSRTPISSEQRAKIRGTYPYYGPTGVLDYIDRYRYTGACALIGEDGDHFLKFKNKPMTLLVSGKFNVNNHAHVVRGSGIARVEWFWLYFLHRDITLHLTRQGAGRFKLTRKALGELPIPLPSLREQDAILERYSETQRRVECEEKLLRKLKLTKQGLMEVLLTGRVRVKVGEDREE